MITALLFALLQIPTVHAQTVGMSFNPSSLTMNIGATQNVIVSGAGPFFIGSNTSPSVASAVLNQNTVTVTAFMAGTDNVSVCSSGSGQVSCGAFQVTVLAATTTNTTSSNVSTAVNPTATISFSPNQLTLNVGDKQTSTVTGSGNGAYIISGVSTNAVTAGISGNTVTVSGVAVGGANVTVCQVGGACGNLYAFVPLTTANSQAAQAVANQQQAPVLSAFYVASNDLGNAFLGRGATLTFKFNTSNDLASGNISVAGQAVSVTGFGNGPYSGSYTLTGSESLPLPVSISFTDKNGLTGHAYFSIGDPTAGQTPQAAAQITPAGTSSTGSSALFTRYLRNGSTGSEVSFLQSTLKKLGFYNGPVTGNFGPLTAAAVKKYQQARGLDQVGVVGPGTRAALNREQ